MARPLKVVYYIKNDYLYEADGWSAEISGVWDMDEESTDATAEWAADAALRLAPVHGGWLEAEFQARKWVIASVSRISALRWLAKDGTVTISLSGYDSVEDAQRAVECALKHACGRCVDLMDPAGCCATRLDGNECGIAGRRQLDRCFCDDGIKREETHEMALSGW